MARARQSGPRYADAWGRIGLMLALALFLNLPFLSACTLPPGLSSILFENAPPPGEEQPPRAVVRQPRRPPPQPRQKPVVVAEIPDEPPRPDLHALYAQLPRNSEGQVMWVRALSEKLISPKQALDPDVKDEDPTDIDVELVPKGQPTYKVVFPHKAHTLWLGCPNCHAGLFEMERGKTVITMDKINKGESCGVCHTNVAIPGVFTCPACHKDMSK